MYPQWMSGRFGSISERGGQVKLSPLSLSDYD